jgi:GNAT superfamily N-acetyltransferase
MDIQLVTLAEHPEFTRWVAEEHFREWGAAHPGATLEAWESDRRGTRRDEVPWTLLALRDSAPVGTAGLVACDMDTHAELTPWLSGVYVTPACRGRGVGTALVRAATARAALWGAPRLYLYTESAERFYARLGWATLRRERYNGLAVTIMDRDPAA